MVWFNDSGFVDDRCWISYTFNDTHNTKFSKVQDTSNLMHIDL